jgi:hypothetical protein
MNREAREQIEDAVSDAYPTVDMSIIESFSDEELHHLLSKVDAVEQVKPDKPVRVKEQVVKPVVERVEGLTLEDSFVVSEGRLMRRVMVRQSVGQFASETVHLEPLGERVRFAGRVYRVSHLMHYLKTGEWTKRISKVERLPRYRARVRTPNGLVHLGYFATVEERDAVMFAHKLGLGKVPSK